MIERRRLQQNVDPQPANNGLAKDSRLQLEQVNIRLLRHAKTNPRVHSDRQITLLRRSINRFGFISPILIDAAKTIIAGHARVKAAEQLGMSTVPALRVEYLTPDECRAFMIADNRLAEKSVWDRSLLAIELQCLSEIGFDIEAIGFEPAEVDILLDEAAEAAETNGPDDVAPPIEKSVVSRAGSLWICGSHRLLCGDARLAQDYDRLLGKEKAVFVFTDPPYNVKVVGHVSSTGLHNEFAMASGEMSTDEFSTFLEDVFRHMSAYICEGSVIQVCMDWRHIAEITLAGENVFSKLLNVCVWCKTNAGMGSLYRSQHELVFVWTKGNGVHTNNIELGRHGRNRSNVWTYPGVNSFRSGRSDELRMHPTVKPVAMVADAIKDCSLRGALIFDPFAGSGTTIIAAEKTGRVARAMEIEPRYVDVAVRRWQAYVGKAAVDADTGLTFEQTEQAKCPRSERDGNR